MQRQKDVSDQVHVVAQAVEPLHRSFEVRGARIALPRKPSVAVLEEDHTNPVRRQEAFSPVEHVAVGALRVYFKDVHDAHATRS